jgi:GNAT superfamily N-acetyltransferase
MREVDFIMPVQFRSYTDETGFSEDFHRVWEFLVRINQKKVVDEGFLWGRWEWMFCLERYLDQEHLSRIGIWEENNLIVALATYESGLGYVWPLVASGYEYLQEDILKHAWENMQKDGCVKVLIDDRNEALQSVAASKGFLPTQEKENNAYLSLEETDITYTLPMGYKVVSLAEDYDLSKYHQVLWKGFNHEGEQEEPLEDQLIGRKAELSGPHSNLGLKIAVMAPDGSFVSFCGMWYKPSMDYALVEPVATIPACRRMGMGKAAVLEGVKRCRELGAKRAFVGSTQQFYYNIGFRPYSTKTWWEKKVR